MYDPFNVLLVLFASFMLNILASMFSVISSVQSLSHIGLFQTPWTEHARLPCTSPTPGGYSNSCPASWWCHPTTSSSVVPFSSCLQTSPASGSFPMSQFFTSSGQMIGVLASASVLPMNIQDWFPLELTDDWQYHQWYWPVIPFSWYLCLVLVSGWWSSILVFIVIISLLFLVLLYMHAAAAKSLQSCLTLYDPIDGSPPGPSIHWIFQVRVLEWVAMSFSVYMHMQV